MGDDNNLDDFLDAIDEDPDWSSDEEDPIAKRADKRDSTPPRETQSSNELTFSDVFGSPIKKKSVVAHAPTTKVASAVTEPTPTVPFDGQFFEKLQQSTPQHCNAIQKPSLSSSFNSKSGLSSGIKNSAKPHGLPHNSSSSSDTVIDPYSRISLFKASVNLYCDKTLTLEAVLKDRNIGIHYVNLLSFSYWYKSSGKDKKFWTSGVLTKKLPGTRKSTKGNDYTLWEVNDLKDVDTSWTLFLFGGASTAPSLADIPIGAFIDIVTPSVLEASSGPLKFSIGNATQIRHIGTARHFGYCQSKRKDGKNCTMVVNTVECAVCIHHASAELKKMNAKSKSKGGGGAIPKNHLNGKRNYPSFEDTTGVVTTDFGFPQPKKQQNMANAKPKIRMELQSGLTSTNMQRNGIKNGNHASITFAPKTNDNLPPLPKKPENKEPLKLDPQKTRHLTEKDRQILEALGSKNIESDLPELLANNPNAGSRNYLQYLAEKQYKLDMARMKGKEREQVEGYGKVIGMNRAMLSSMQKALSYVRKNGPITKGKTNTGNSSGVKRKLEESPSSTQSSSSSTANSATSGSSSNSDKLKKPKSNIEVVFDFESDDFKQILNAKSKHESILEEVHQEEYFDKLEKKEAIENKLLNTFMIPTSAVMCRECKYVALSRSEYCKEQQHQVKVVKAVKRFFKCRNCGNRAMSLDRLPKHPCSNCKNTSWLTAPVGKEKAGPLLPSEVLSIRGDEEKFAGSSSGKMFLNLSA